MSRELAALFALESYRRACWEEESEARRLARTDEIICEAGRYGTSEAHVSDALAFLKEAACRARSWYPRFGVDDFLHSDVMHQGGKRICHLPAEACAYDHEKEEE